MSGNVVEFDGPTRLDMPADKVLDGAKGKDLENLLVIGWTQDGELYLAASSSDAAMALWTIKHAELSVMGAFE